MTLRGPLMETVVVPHEAGGDLEPHWLGIVMEATWSPTG